MRTEFSKHFEKSESIYSCVVISGVNMKSTITMHKPISELISIVLVFSMLIGLTSCKRDLNSKIKVEIELSQLNNVEGNIYVSDKKEYQEITNYLQYIATEADFEGSIMVATDDEIIFAAGTSLLDVDGNEVTPYTTYEIGSNTKSFVGVCIMSLIEKNKLSMNTTLGELFPEYSSFPSYEKIAKITISNLLYMRSGLVDYVNDLAGFIGAEKYEEIFGPDPESNVTYAEWYRMIEETFNDDLFMECLFTTEPLSDPDVKLVYSNTNYHLLALIIERVSGMTFEEYVSQVVFEPCNMKSSSSVKSGDVTAAYEYSEKYDYLSYPEFAMGAGDIHSNVVDMLKYDRAVFGGYLLNAKSTKELFMPVDGYACGWMLSDNFIYHNGDTPRFSTSNYIIEKNGKRIYVILMSTFRGDYRSVIPKYVDMIL